MKVTTRGAGGKTKKLVSCSEMSPEELAALRRLWPHRDHESGRLKGLICARGLKRAVAGAWYGVHGISKAAEDQTEPNTHLLYPVIGYFEEDKRDEHNVAHRKRPPRLQVVRTAATVPYNPGWMQEGTTTDAEPVAPCFLDFRRFSGLGGRRWFEPDPGYGC
jgi:hypothetical protein